MLKAAAVSSIIILLAVAPGLPAEEPKPAPAPKPEAPKASLSGFAQFDYRRGDDAGQASATDHEFNVRRARLTVAGSAHKRVSYSLTVQLESTSAAVLDALVDVELKPLARLRVGQYKYDFDLAGRESSSALAFLDRPFATNAVAGSLNGQSTPSSTLSNFRDRGLTLFGDTKDRRVNWGYGLGLFQGTGRTSDNNDAFSYTANLRVWPTKDLRLNAGLLSSDNLAKGAAGEDRYEAWTVGGTWEHGRGHARAEYYSGTRDRGTSEGRVRGYYVHGSYSPAARLDLLARYQWSEDDRLPAGDRSADSIDLGLRWYFVRKAPRSGTHVSVNYMSRSADPAFGDRLTLLNDGRGPLLKSGSLVKGVLAARLQVQF